MDPPCATIPIIPRPVSYAMVWYCDGMHAMLAIVIWYGLVCGEWLMGSIHPRLRLGLHLHHSLPMFDADRDHYYHAAVAGGDGDGHHHHLHHHLRDHHDHDHRDLLHHLVVALPRAIDINATHHTSSIMHVRLYGMTW